jgi:hypothetical protein
VIGPSISMEGMIVVEVLMSSSDATDEGGSEGGAQADGEGDEMG